MERRHFIKTVTAGSVGMTMSGISFPAGDFENAQRNRIGIIGLDIQKKLKNLELKLSIQ